MSHFQAMLASLRINHQAVYADPYHTPSTQLKLKKTLPERKSAQKHGDTREVPDRDEEIEREDDPARLLSVIVIDGEQKRQIKEYREGDIESQVASVQLREQKRDRSVVQDEPKIEPA